MSEIVVIGDTEPDEPSIPVDDAVDLIDSAIEHVADAIAADDAGGQHDDNMAFIAGVTVAALDALTGRVEVLEQRVLVAEVAAEHAEVLATDALEVAITDDGPPIEVEEPVVEADEPPDTWKSKMNRAWFGKRES